MNGLILKLFGVLACLLLGAGCVGGGVHLRMETESDDTETGRESPSETATRASSTSGSSVQASSDLYQAWISSSAGSIQGASGISEGNRYQMSDTFLELGIEETEERVSE